MKEIVGLRIEKKLTLLCEHNYIVSYKKSQEERIDVGERYERITGQIKRH